MDWACVKTAKIELKKWGGGTPAFFCQSFTKFACRYASFLKRSVGTVGKAPSWVEGWTNDWHLLHWLWWLSCWWRQWWLRRRYSNDDVWSKRWLWSLYHEDESMTFFKQVNRTLNFKLEIRVSQEYPGLKATFSPGSSWVWVGEEPVNVLGGWKALRMGGRRER